ncbi:MAG TPA: hypothetical protein VHM31_22100 [Polyangia bacterium]|nr:hypothetical protein [Polyangia bacterium]
MPRRLAVKVVSTSFLLAFTGALAGSRIAQGKVVGPPQIAWKDMSYAQKKAYMKEAVMPTMKPIFQAFDAKKFKTFECQTCHGADGADRKYKMPSNDIHPLPNSKEGFEAKLKTEPTWPKWTEFMSKKVEPAMGKLLDVPVFDPQKPVKDAFSCGACHKLEATKT